MLVQEIRPNKLEYDTFTQIKITFAIPKLMQIFTLPKYVLKGYPLEEKNAPRN